MGSRQRAAAMTSPSRGCARWKISFQLFHLSLLTCCHLISPFLALGFQRWMHVRFLHRSALSDCHPYETSAIRNTYVPISFCRGGLYPPKGVRPPSHLFCAVFAQRHMLQSGGMIVLPSLLNEYSTAMRFDPVARLTTKPVDSRLRRVLVSIRCDTFPT